MRTLAWLLAGVLGVLSARAAVDPALYQALKWRLIGPFRGGRVVAVGGVPGDSTTFYFGSVNGGIWKTTDAGIVWKPIFDGQPVASIGALAVAAMPRHLTPLEFDDEAAPAVDEPVSSAVYATPGAEQ